jgi:hypothetical protein
MIDGIKSFVTGLSSASPVLRPEAVHEFTERIVNPRPPKKEMAAVSAAMARPAWEEENTQPPPSQQVSRARAIFDASEEAKPFNPADFDFEMTDEEAVMDAVPPSEPGSTSVESLPPPKRKRVLGMTSGQWIVLAGLAITLLILLVVFAYLVLSSITLLP